MLDLNKIQNSVIQEIPYKWVLFENLISKEEIFDLVDQYPEDGFCEFSNERHTYLEKVIIKKGEVTPELFYLSKVWQKLIEELCTPAYKYAMEALTGLNLQNHLISIDFVKYNIGHWTGPHKDYQFKTLTHLLYFNQQWFLEWGGCFRVLLEDKPESVFQDIPPLLQYSVALVRSEHSWHMVTPVSPKATQPRLTLQIAFFQQK